MLVEYSVDLLFHYGNVIVERIAACLDWLRCFSINTSVADMASAADAIYVLLWALAMVVGFCALPPAVAQEQYHRNSPCLTCLACLQRNRPAKVAWGNELLDPVTKNYLPHLLKESIDQTLLWYALGVN